MKYLICIPKMASTVWMLLLLHLLGYFWYGSDAICPDIPNCHCPESKNKHIKLRCSRISSVNDLFANDKFTHLTAISHLDLSNNSLQELPADSFPVSINTKLNLDRNFIETIHDNAFRGLHNLKKLVLSNNKLKELRQNMFAGLDSVDQLKIGQNLISTIRDDTFDYLPALKQLDISGNPLICSCDMWWLLSSRFKLNPLPKCDFPESVHGQFMDKAFPRPECNPVYSFSISPDQDQIAFEGDSLKMICVLSGLGKQTAANQLDQLISWTWEGRNPNNLFDNASQFQDVYSDNDTIESTLIISELYDKHSGEWSCNSLSPKLNRSLSVKVNVLSKDTIYCDVTVTQDDKGRYTWPETVAGHLVDLPCEIGSDTQGDVLLASNEVVTYFCSNNGSWLNLNTDNCPYMSPVTRILQEFSKMNLTNHKASLIESATGLRNYTLSNRHNIVHVKDFHFIVTTIENYIKFVKSEPDLGFYLLEIISGVLQLPKHLLEKAQQQHFACSRLLETIQEIVKYCPSLEYTSKEFALTQVSLYVDSFVGITCSWVKNLEDLTLNCSAPNKTVIVGSSIMEASVQISMNLLNRLDTKVSRLAVTLFNDSRLFPDRNIYKESSMVIGAYIVGSTIVKFEESMTISIKNTGFSILPMLAWWDIESGLWTKDICQLSSSFYSTYLKFSCDKMGYFSLLTESYDELFYSDRNVQQRLLFHFLHWSVYVGTFIGVTCLMLASATYCFCYVYIQMSKKMKHSLMNSWLSTSCLFLVFSVGIHQTDHEVLCQTIGLSLHYFALATLFWMSITIKALYKRVQKSNRSVSTPSEDLPADVPIEKPILGIYLVGWGISAIICGISGAVNIRGYSGSHYCFLSPGPGLCTVFIPASMIMFYLLIMCLLVRCAASSVDSNPQLSVGTQAIDLELLEGCGANGMGGGRSSYTHEGCNSVRSITTPSSQAEDTEHSPVRQLKAFVIFWIFYMLATVSAAVCVMQPFTWQPYEEKIFSMVYAAMCLLLGAFILFFHCFARSDVRSAWSRILRGQSLHSKSPHIIANSFMPSAPTPHTLSSVRMNGPGPAGYDGQAGTLNNFKKTIAADNRSTRSDFLKQTPNINLVRLHRQHYRGCSTLMADGNFYNPHQSIVAKKFFKKQRRKRNNSLQVRRCRSGGSSPVSSALLFDGDVTRMRMGSMVKRHDDIDGCDNEENMQFLRRPNMRDDRFEQLSSEKHPLTYDDPDMTGCEEGKTGTESEATFTVPEYAEIHEQNSAMMEHNVPPRIPTKEQMCGTSDHDWGSCDAISDVNSEPTYNYAYIRNGYASPRSVISDNSSGNSHLYTAVVDDVANSVDRHRRPRPRARPPRTRAEKTRAVRVNYRPPTKGAPHHHHHHDYSSEFNAVNNVGNGDFRKRRKEDVYKQVTTDSYLGLSPSSDFGSEDKVETCV